MKDDSWFGPLLFIALVGAAIWWLYRQATTHPPATSQQYPPGTVINPQPTQDPVITGIENKIPVIGPVAAAITQSAGSAIVNNQWLQANSQVGPNKGQTLASAGVAGITFIPNGGISWSTVGHGIESVGKKLEFWNW